MTIYTKARYANLLMEYLAAGHLRCNWGAAENWVLSNVDWHSNWHSPSKEKLLIVRRWLASLGLLMERGDVRVTKIQVSSLGMQVCAIKENRIEYLAMLAQYGSIENGAVASDIALARLLRDFHGPRFRLAMQEVARGTNPRNTPPIKTRFTSEKRLRTMEGDVGTITHPLSHHLWYKHWKQSR